MSNKKVTMYLILGMLFAIFLLRPMLDYFGIMQLEDFFTSMFGANNLLVPILSFVFSIVVIGAIYYVNSKKREST